MVHDYPPLEGGGLEINTKLIAEALAKLGWSVTIATTRLSSESYKPNTEEAEPKGVKVIYLTAPKQLQELLEDADTVHVHLTFSLRAGSLAAMEGCVKSGRNFVATVHTSPKHIPYSRLAKLTPFERRSLIERAKSLLNSPSAEVIAPSLAVRRTLVKFGISKTITVIPPGVAIKDGKTADKGYLLFAGEIGKLKGVETLLEALKITNSKGLKLSLKIAGGGNLTWAKKLVRKLELGPQVEPLGYIPNSNLAKLIGECGIFIAPSRTEAWGIAACEALSMGKIVVASNTEGLREALQNGKFGLLFEPNNPEDLAEKIEIALKEKRYYLKKAEEGKKFVLKNMTLGDQIKSLLPIYGRIQKTKA